MKIDMKKALYCLLGLTFLQDSSADVTKLRLNDDIVKSLNRNNEVWVNTENGEIWVKKTTTNGSFWRNKTTKVDGIDPKWLHIMRTNIKPKNNYSVSYRYNNAIYSDKFGNVVINLKFDNGEDERKESAKQQFENIIKCGLVDDNSFNGQIYNNPFNDNRWQMPGISAFIKDGKDTANVYCAMKRPHPKGEYSFVTKEEYTQILNQNFPTTSNEHIGNYEHTERQLLLNYFTNIDGNLWFNGNTIKPMWDIFGNINDINNGNLLIWTHGNPCAHGGCDNGRYSCVQWYRHICPILQTKNVNVNVFFSYLADQGEEFNRQTEQTSIGIRDQDRRYTDNYLMNALSRNMNYKEGYCDCASVYNILRELEDTKNDLLVSKLGILNVKKNFLSVDSWRKSGEIYDYLFIGDHCIKNFYGLIQFDEIKWSNILKERIEEAFKKASGTIGIEYTYAK